MRWKDGNFITVREGMEKIEYRLCENQLKAEDFIRLKVATGFRDRPIYQVGRALQNDLFDIVAKEYIAKNIKTKL